MKESRFEKYIKSSKEDIIKDKNFEANPDQFVQDEITSVNDEWIEKIVEIGQQKKVIKIDIKLDRLYELAVNNAFKKSKCFRKVFGLGQNYTGQKILDGFAYLEMPYNHLWIAIDAKSVVGDKKYMFDEISNIRILRAAFEIYKLTKHNCFVILVVANNFSDKNVEISWKQFIDNGRILVPITSLALKIIAENFTNGKFWSMINICLKESKIIDENYVKLFV